MQCTHTATLALLLCACDFAAASESRHGARPSSEEHPAPTPILVPSVVSPRRSERAAARPAQPKVSEATTSVMRAGLASSDWMVRLATTEALGCFPSGAATTWLERQLADVEPDVRAAAITSLSYRPDARARSLLLSVQNDSTEELSLRVLAATAVTRPINPCE